MRSWTGRPARFSSSRATARVGTCPLWGGLILLLASCATGSRVGRPDAVDQDFRPVGQGTLIRPLTWSRVMTSARRDDGVARFDLAFEGQDDEILRFVNRNEYDFDSVWRTYVVWQPLSWVDDGQGSDRKSTTGDVRLGVNARWFQGVLPVADGQALDLEAGVEAFAVWPTGQPKAPRWPGVVDSNEGYFVVGNVRGGNHSQSLALNLGAGGQQQPGTTGYTARYLMGAAFNQGIGFGPHDSGESGLRIGLESFWTLAPAEDQEFGEVSLLLGFWVDTAEITVGYRAGLTEESPDWVLFVNFGTRLFDTLF